MIKREYFVRAKISHNDNTGFYSWWSGTFAVKTWFKLSGKDLFNAAMDISYLKITEQEQSTKGKQVEIISLNRM
jgi:hypothetical protein